jgi:hypothetical protein
MQTVGVNSPFADLEHPDTPLVTNPRQRRRGSGGWWKGLLVLLAVMGITGAVLAFTWPKIKPMLLATEEAKSVKSEKQDSFSSDPVDSLPPRPAPKTKSAPVTHINPDQVLTPATRPLSQPRRPPEPTRPPEFTRPPEKPRDPRPIVRPPEPVVIATPFPRRALVISVHNYLYANPVQYGTPGGRDFTVAQFVEALAQHNGMKIPLTQVAHLSDLARVGPRPPMKGVIERAVVDFLSTSRPQDRIVLFFIGRGIELHDEAYLVPIDGELDNTSTLLPLKWVYEQLAGCKARQKVLVVDVSRFSPTRGLERPDGGPLDAKFEAALKNPPPTVQVWSACSAGQRSYETDDAQMGAFLKAFLQASRRGVQGKIQKPDDPLPLDYVHTQVNELLELELKKRKLQQVSFLSGEEAQDGSAYDKNEPLPRSPSLPPVAANKATEQLVKAVLAEIGTPNVKPSLTDGNLKFDALPPFSADVLKKYEEDAEPESPLLKAVRTARALLWAISPAAEPADLSAEVAQIRSTLKGNLSVLQDGFRAAAPALENQLKNRIMNNERDVARLMGRLTEALEELKNAGNMRDAAPKRWQANYDFMLARLEAQIAFLYEYQSMLGQMRKEFPPRDPNLHGGWILAATTTLQGDATGKKLAKDSRKILEKLSKDHAGTPWEVLAKREKLTALGLEWQPTR